MTHPITRSSNSKQVYVNLLNSPIAQRISREPNLLTLASALLKTKKLTGKEIDIEQDMGRPIGMTEVVETTDADVVFYAKENKSPNFKRFVKNKKSESTSLLCMRLVQDDKGDYELIDVHAGQALAEPLTGENDSKAALAFWPAFWAKRKGYSFLLIALLGIVTSFLFALIVVAFLRDKNKPTGYRNDSQAADSALKNE